ncbi:PBSX family phage terminase large subunit [Rhodanobacter glycinis]|uniref:PBSX family phage terminase large subunit n=1 Tax=Rhodanobacter glycinis TaxID=582702 RepID=A0A502C6P2_9GAMM|nr:PBSX family phage terminase large subunit [Rhodanobacter glycinis]TPG08314.1 PBSX family phage terminase large subunit [Rhodanobacter glycinis]
MNAVSANLAPQVQLQMPAKLLPLLQPWRFKILHGGRGGAKSHTVAQILIMLSMQRKLRILCVREVQKSLAQSSMQVLKDYIERLGVSAYFDVVKAEIRCRTTGSTFSFAGLKDHTADSIKSFEGADIVWVEEAHSVTTHSWTILIPTILRTDGSEIWATYNPDQETDYVHNRFVVNNDPDALVICINWRDNPWFNAAMNDERLKLKAVNDDLYDHVWEGKCRSLAGLLFKRKWFNRYDLSKHPSLNTFLASDYAGGQDPDHPERKPDNTEHGCAGLDCNGDMWFTDWYTGEGEDPDVWIQGWLTLIRRNKPLMAFEESGVILRTTNGSIVKAMQKAKTYVQRVSIPSAGSKASRALGFAMLASAGQVWIPNTEWGDRLINQLCAFTGQDGRADDMVDVCGLLARGIDQMPEAAAPPPPPPEPPKPFTDAWFSARDKADTLSEADKQRYYR